MLRRAMIVTLGVLGVAFFGTLLGCEETTASSSADPHLGGESAGGAQAVAGVEGGRTETGGVTSAGQEAGAQVNAGTWINQGTSGQEAGAREEVEGGIEVSAGVQAGESAGAQAGGNPPVMEEEEEVSCLRSCVDFVECALDSCEGYDDSDTRFLMNECLSICIDPIAIAFDRLKNCDDKLRFAFTFRADFGQYCGSISEGFCETFIETCGPWTGEESCEAHYNEAPERGTELNAGAHRACYEYHLSDARRALNRGELEEAQLRCEHAAGLSVCVD